MNKINYSRQPHLKRRKTGKRMPPRRLIASSYSLFLSKLKGREFLQGLSFKTRAEKLAKLWEDLPAAQKTFLRKQATKSGLYVPKRPVSNKGKSAYHRFVADQAKQLKGLSPDKRMQIISEKWRAAKRARSV